MGFKVGDKVKILNTEFGNKDKIGTITNISGSVMIYFVEIEGDCGHVCQWSNASDLELVTEEETNMGFKVGDRVQVVAQYSVFYGDKGTVIENDGTDNLPIHVNFDVDERVCWFYENDLKVLHEEEKVMKFKVGDKVKVKDSWFGFTGEVGLIVRIDGPAKYPYRVKFDVVDEEDEELFAEGSLELVKEKQSFTKSDLKTGMGVVLRNGDKAHVLLGTDDGDVMRFLEKDTWDTLESANEDLTWKGMDNFDIVEVYSTTLASRYLTDMVFEAKCVFKREEPKPEPEPTKMTMKEINEHFGKVIEIIE